MQPGKTAFANLVYDLPSILERLDLAALFPKPQPLEVELGCGDASFLVEYAKRHPERNFIGVERLLGRVCKVDRKGRRAGLANLRGVRIESAYFLEYLLPPHSVSALHIYFPDPWPKRRHWPNRLVNARFPELARQALAPGGVVYLRTDDRSYFEQMLAVFQPKTEVARSGDALVAATSVLGFKPAAAFQPVETPVELSEVVTDFESGFRARGIETLRAAYRLSQGSFI